MSRPILEGGGLFGRVSFVDIDRPVGAHAHPQCHALFNVGGDATLFDVDGHLYPISADTVVLINAWQPHCYPFVPGAAGRSRLVAFYVEPRWLSDLDPGFRSCGRREFFPQACVRVSADLRELVRHLADEFGGQRVHPTRACALIQAVMVELVTRYSRYRDLPRATADQSPPASDYRIRKALALIRERATEELDVDALAREVAMSRPHFFALFRRLLGITPNAYRNVLRMEHAYRALLETSTPVSQIAAGLGFTAHAHFTRFFQTSHGVSPDAYRRVAWRIV